MGQSIQFGRQCHGLVFRYSALTKRTPEIVCRAETSCNFEEPYLRKPFHANVRQVPAASKCAASDLKRRCAAVRWSSPLHHVRRDEITSHRESPCYGISPVSRFLNSFEATCCPALQLLISYSDQILMTRSVYFATLSSSDNNRNGSAMACAISSRSNGSQ
jgi:hypothetical protein